MLQPQRAGRAGAVRRDACRGVRRAQQARRLGTRGGLARARRSVVRFICAIVDTIAARVVFDGSFSRIADFGPVYFSRPERAKSRSRADAITRAPAAKRRRRLRQVMSVLAGMECRPMFLSRDRTTHTAENSARRRFAGAPYSAYGGAARPWLCASRGGPC